MCERGSEPEDAHSLTAEAKELQRSSLFADQQLAVQISSPFFLAAPVTSKQNFATRAGCNLNWSPVKTVVSRGTTVSITDGEPKEASDSCCSSRDKARENPMFSVVVHELRKKKPLAREALVVQRFPEPKFMDL